MCPFLGYGFRHLSVARERFRTNSSFREVTYAEAPMVSNADKHSASLYLYAGNPLVIGSLTECASFWQSKLSSFGQTLARIRVHDSTGAYWLVAEDIKAIAPKSSAEAG